MTWQNPWAWLGLASLALLILVHLFTRQRARTEPFPSLRFINVSRLLPTRSTRLNDIPLLLVRLAILAFAVAALAQPLLNTGARQRASNAALARVVLVDTSGAIVDSLSVAAVEDSIAAVSPATTTLRLYAHTPAQQLAGAVQWIRRQPGRGEIVVLSRFREWTLDSVDVAGIPTDIGVTLHRLSAAVDSTPARYDAVVWASTATRVANATGTTIDDAWEIRQAVLSAARDAGASLLVDSVGDSAVATSPGAALPVSASRGAALPGRTIVVASPDADSLDAWSARAVSLSRPWMGDALLAVQRDTVVATAALSLTTAQNTAAGPEDAASATTGPFVVVRRTAKGRPAVLAAALPDVGANSRLLVVVRAPESHVLTASVLLAASRALAPENFRTALSSGSVSSPTGASTASTTESASGNGIEALLSDESLRRWTRPASVEGAAEPRRMMQADGGRDTGPSDARYGWMLVLALLGLESWMRRPRRARITDAPTSSATS